jgi:hypothetical protein
VYCIVEGLTGQLRIAKEGRIKTDKTEGIFQKEYSRRNILIF